MMRRIFTLIEMLVVMAVIAILSALLLPALGQAREMGRRLVCLNNVKGLGQAFSLYADDYDGRFPVYYGNVGGAGWPSLFFFDYWVAKIMLYTGQASFANATASWGSATKPPPGVWDCPSNACTRSNNGMATNYAYNKELEWTKLGRPMSWKRSSIIPIVVDAGNNPASGALGAGCNWSGCQAGPGVYNGGFWHNNGFNAVFLDGHAAYRKDEGGKALPNEFFPQWYLWHGTW